MTTETKRNPFPPQHDPVTPALPTWGDWLGGIALFAALWAGSFIVGALQ